MSQSVPPIKGAASVNPGDRGFTNITPPEWSDAYLRIKANNEQGLDVELVMFLPEETAWGVAREFTLETCK